MATHSSIHVWRFHGQRSLASYSPYGGSKSGMTEVTWHAHSTYDLDLFFFFFCNDSDVENLGSISIFEVLSVLSFSKSIASRGIQSKYFSHYLFIN